MRKQDAQIIERVRGHHAAMDAHLQRLTTAVAQAPNLAELAQALSAILRYWRQEVMPHAAAEETTIYAAAAPLDQMRGLVPALEHEHRDLRRRARRLLDLHALVECAVAGPTVSAAPGGGPTLFVQAAVEAAGAEAVFRIHADKENDFVLPALAEAGQPLSEILTRMEQAFADARRAAEAAPVPS